MYTSDYVKIWDAVRTQTVRVEGRGQKAVGERQTRGDAKEKVSGGFPGGPVVKTSPSSAGGAGLIPGQGAKIPHASQPKKTKI